MVSIKKVMNADSGTADIVGGDDWDTVAGTLTDGFASQDLKLKDPTGTYTGTLINPDLTANANLDFGFPSEGEYIAYRVGSTYKAKGLRQNNIIYSGSVAETAIQTAITAAGTYGTTIIPDRNYTLSGAFAGFDLFYHSKLIMSRGAIIDIPTGYSGSVFKLYESNTATHVTISGGLIEELTTPSRLWTCFDINSTSLGAYAYRIYDTRIYAANKAIAINTDATGWSNASVFSGIYADTCNIFTDFVHTNAFTDAQSGANNNTWIGCTHQATTSATHGFKNVNGRRNQMINCYIADFTGAQITCNITANAKWTRIDGGSVTALNFADLTPAGYESDINDAYQGDVSRNRKSYSYNDMVAISAPASPATGTVRQYVKTIDANNDGLFEKRRLNGAVVEVQIA